MNTGTLKPSHRAMTRQYGVSLVEILVGVAIGLIGIVMMLQLTENWEARKRTTASGSDAQVSGSIASHKLTQDVRQGGYGFGTADARVGCLVTAYDINRASPALNQFRMVPVRIFNGASGAPDQIWVLYGNSASLSAHHLYAETTSATKKTKTNGPRTGIHRGEVVVVAPDATNCGLVEITANTNVDGLTIEHKNENYELETGISKDARYNNPVGYLGTPTGSTGSLYNLGDAPSLNMWRVSGRILQACNYLQADCLDPGTAWTDVAEGIINLQAEYGLDTDNDYVIDTWQSADPATWSQVRAVRVAILARSQHYEKIAVTTQTPATGWLDAADSPVLFSMSDLDGNAPASDDSPDDWRHYRYRIYTTVIPLKNMVWGTMPGVAP